jgi:hypothetical protein
MAISKKNSSKKTGGKVRAAPKRSSTPTVRSKNGNGKKAVAKKTPASASKVNAKNGKKPVENITRASTRSLGISENERLRQAELLLDLSRRIGAMESLDEILATMVEMTTWEVGAERGRER